MTGSVYIGCYQLWIFGMSETKYNKTPGHIKILDKILSFKGELRSFLLNLQFIQWNRICHCDYIWIILVDEFDKLHQTG